MPVNTNSPAVTVAHNQPEVSQVLENLRAAVQSAAALTGTTATTLKTQINTALATAQTLQS